MLVWQRCRYTAAPATVQATAQRGGRKHNALLSLCLKIFGFFFFFLPSPSSSLCEHLLVDGNQSQLLALTVVFHFSVAFTSALLPGEMQSGARMGIIYLTGVGGGGT